jgi:hypothetical protein
MADWQAAQYWTRISGDATAPHTMQLLGMIAVGMEWSEGSVVDIVDVVDPVYRKVRRIG